MRTAFLASFVWSCHEQLNFQRIDLPSEYMTSRPLREWAWQEELGSVYFDYTVLLFGILSRFGNSLYSAMLFFFFWLILCNLGSLRDVCDYCSLHNSHNCHIKMMKKREWPVRHHDTIISKKNFFDHFWISAKDVRDITRSVHMIHEATPPRCVITNEIQSHDSNRDLKALCRKNFSWR